MGVRSRNRRNNRRRCKERARRRRRAMMLIAHPGCPECGAALLREESIAEIWDCPSCARSFLKLGTEFAPEIGAPLKLDFDVPLRRAA